MKLREFIISKKKEDEEAIFTRSLSDRKFMILAKNLKIRKKEKLNFSLDFFDHLGKRLDKKADVDLKIYYVTDWETNNYNTHIAQYFKK